MSPRRHLSLVREIAVKCSTLVPSLTAVLVSASGGTAVTAGSAPGAADGPSYCLLRSSSEHCYDSFRALVYRVTANAGRPIGDAPLTVPAGGLNATAALRGRMEQIRPNLSGMLFTGHDGTGGVLIVERGDARRRPITPPFPH